jgi:ATP-binding cassette subfamily B protein
MWLELWRGLDGTDRRRLEFAAVAMLAGSGLTSLTPLLIGEFVDHALTRGKTVDLSAAITPLIVLAAALLLISALEVAQHQLVHVVTTSFQAGARQRIYAALMRWPLSRYVEGARGAIYGRANRSVEGAEKLIKLGAAELLPAVAVALFAVVLAIIRYGVVGLIIAVVIPIGFGLVAWQVRSQANIRTSVRRAKEQIDGDVSAWLGLLDVIRVTGSEGFFNGKIRTRTRTLRETELRHHIAMSLFDAAKAVNETICLLLTLVLTLLLRPHISPGQLTGVVLLYLAVTKPLRDLHRVIDEGSESAGQAADLLEDLAHPHDPIYTAPACIPATSDQLAPAFELKDVSFTYAPGADAVLRSVSLSIQASEAVGLVGLSGSGKTTLLRLLARLQPGFSGRILLKGRDLESYVPDELRTILGYVGQRPQLFAGSIRENILMGLHVNDEALAAACQRANILTDILRLPVGFDSPLGEDGARFSGGQQQRLCLARALVRNPAIMLLDEPTSALDPQSQASVQHAIDELSDVAKVVVAHRVHTLRGMDMIVVLDQGRIVERGSFDELLDRRGLFAAMAESERQHRKGGLKTALVGY